MKKIIATAVLGASLATGASVVSADSIQFTTYDGTQVTYASGSRLWWLGAYNDKFRYINVPQDSIVIAFQHAFYRGAGHILEPGRHDLSQYQGLSGTSSFITLGKKRLDQLVDRYQGDTLRAKDILIQQLEAENAYLLEKKDNLMRQVTNLQDTVENIKAEGLEEAIADLKANAPTFESVTAPTVADLDVESFRTTPTFEVETGETTTFKDYDFKTFDEAGIKLGVNQDGAYIHSGYVSDSEKQPFGQYTPDHLKAIEANGIKIHAISYSRDLHNSSPDHPDLDPLRGDLAKLIGAHVDLNDLDKDEFSTFMFIGEETSGPNAGINQLYMAVRDKEGNLYHFLTGAYGTPTDGSSLAEWIESDSDRKQRAILSGYGTADGGVDLDGYLSWLAEDNLATWAKNNDSIVYVAEDADYDSRLTTLAGLGKNKDGEWDIGILTRENVDSVQKTLSIDDSVIGTFTEIDGAIETTLDEIEAVAEKAFNKGFDAGFRIGFSVGYKRGYVDGYNDAVSGLESRFGN